MKTFFVLIYFADRIRPQQYTINGHTFADALMRLWIGGVDDSAIVRVEIYP